MAIEGYAMKEGTTSEAEIIRLRQDLSSLFRRRILEAVELVLEEELSEACRRRSESAEIR